MRRVLVVGDVMTDVIVRPDGPLLRGSDRSATIRRHPGGSGANQAAWLGHFGVPVRFAARVGAAEAAACAAELERFGVEPHCAADPVLPTGATITLLDADGERSFFTDRGANDALSEADLPDALLEGIAMLHVSGYALFTPGPRAAVLGLVARARERGCAVSVDPASTGFLAEVGAAAFLDWTQGWDLCFPNAAEAALLASTPDAARQREVLSARYGGLAVKRGAEGAELVAGGVLLRQAAPVVAAVDTTGAGDAFLAAFLAGRIAGAEDDACLRSAVAAGAAAVTALGGRPRP